MMRSIRCCHGQAASQIRSATPDSTVPTPLPMEGGGVLTLTLRLLTNVFNVVKQPCAVV